METLRLVLLFVHILGYAALLGGLLVQVREETKAVNPLMRDGIGTAFLAGLLLVGVLESLGSPDHAKIGVKFADRAGDPGAGDGQHAQAAASRRASTSACSLLTIANIAVAVFWSPVHA